MNANERKVFEALDDPKWDARTLGGISRSTGLPEFDVLKILNANSHLIDAYSTSKFGLVFQLKQRTTPRDTPFVEKVLDYMSMGNRRRIA